MASYAQTEVKIVFNILPTLGDAARTALSQLVRKAAHDVESLAKANAPVDTGALRASIHVITSDGSDYKAVARQVRRINKKHNTNVQLLTEVERPDSPLQAFVVVGVDYGVPVEFGTARRAATPYLLPAAEQVEKPFLDAVGATIEAAAKGLI